MVHVLASKVSKTIRFSHDDIGKADFDGEILVADIESLLKKWP